MHLTDASITDWSKNLRVEVRGDDVAQHAGCVLPRMLADATGLTEGLSAAVSRPEVTHDRGAVHVVDGASNARPLGLAVSLACLFEDVG